VRAALTWLISLEAQPSSFRSSSSQAADDEWVIGLGGGQINQGVEDCVVGRRGYAETLADQGRLRGVRKRPPAPFEIEEASFSDREFAGIFHALDNAPHISTKQGLPPLRTTTEAICMENWRDVF
jgi:hypothetical protein